MFRSEVGKNITARLTPSLEFIHDALPENAKHLDELLAQARERDSSIEALKSTATYAGDEDPYVKPRDYDAEDDDLDDSDEDDDSDADEDDAPSR